MQWKKRSVPVSPPPKITTESPPTSPLRHGNCTICSPTIRVLQKENSRLSDELSYQKGKTQKQMETEKNRYKRKMDELRFETQEERAKYEQIIFEKAKEDEKLAYQRGVDKTTAENQEIVTKLQQEIVKRNVDFEALQKLLCEEQTHLQYEKNLRQQLQAKLEKNRIQLENAHKQLEQSESDNEQLYQELQTAKSTAKKAKEEIIALRTESYSSNNNDRQNLVGAFPLLHELVKTYEILT